MTVLLLDTHVWLWGLDQEARQLGRRTLGLLDRWGARDGLRISPLSVFEVVALHAAGRLRLSRPAGQWVDAALAAPGVRLAPFTAASALDAGSIGVSHLPDPIDRMLVATARQLEATLVTRDRRILEYAARTSAVRVHDATR
jgi:PIN domain nuclease of toxin-antitoxin system